MNVTLTAYCMAVSTTSDATQSYYRYEFSFGSNTPDYPKLAVWPNAYYWTANTFSGANTFLGANPCAFDRATMLSGGPANAICMQQNPSVDSLLPADLDGTTPPPAGEPNFYLQMVAPSNLNLFKFHVDFTTPSNSTFTGPTAIPVASFSEACGRGTCIPQPGTMQQLDSLGDRLMFRLAYRNFGDHESLVVNHSVTAGSSVWVRWYEIRSPNATPTVFQQGTFSPDSQYRWMGSIAMDQSGDIAVGYSASSSSNFPAVRYTGRVPSDPAGTMESENSIIEGTGSQTNGNGGSRWGDYSSMSIDPVDDCTFWYTNEYLTTNGSFNWKTRIASLKFTSCGPPGSPSATTLISSLNPSALGQAVTFTATVTSSATGTPTGTVTFQDGASALGTGTLSGGTATFTTSGLTAGTRSITAIYGGDANFAGSTSPVLTQTVNKAASSTSAVSSNSPSNRGAAVTFTASVTSPVTGTPTGTVTFQDGASALGTGTLSGGTATFTTSALTAGTHSITAIYGGDANFTGSTSPILTQTINQTASSSAVVTSSNNPSIIGTAVTFTASVTSPVTGTLTGTVTFQDGASALGTGTLSGGTATFTTSGLTAGTHSITVIYGGDANFAGSTSPVLTQTVNKAASSTSVVSSNSPSNRGAAVTFTASVTSPVTGTPTGTVTFQDGASALGTGTLSGGTATFTTSALTAGTHSITAIYGGDANFTGSTSPILTQTIGKAASSTAVASSNNPSIIGPAVTLTPSGLTGGTHSITAVYSGDANFAGSTSPPLVQTVNKTGDSTSVASSNNPSIFGSAVTFTATVTSSATSIPTGTVTFQDGAATLGTGMLSGGNATLATSALVGGVHSITAVYGGDANFANSTSPVLMQTVNKAASSTSVVSSNSASNRGAAVTFTATVTSSATGTPTGTVTFQDAATTLGTGTLSGGTATFTTSGLGTGAHSIAAIYGGDANFTGSTSPILTQTIGKAVSSTAVASSNNPSIIGTAVTLTATVTSPVTGTLTGTVTFQDGTSALGTGTLSGGAATFTTSGLTGGTHSITAVYSGDANFAGSTSPPLVQTVNKTGDSTSVASSNTPSIFGSAVTFTATVKPATGSGTPTGTVTLNDGATVLGTGMLSGGNATLATSALVGGVHSITAVYGGDANFANSTSPVLLQTVNKAASSTSVVSSNSASNRGAAVTFTATVTSSATGTPTGTVTFQDAATTLGT